MMMKMTMMTMKKTTRKVRLQDNKRRKNPRFNKALIGNKLKKLNNKKLFNLAKSSNTVHMV